MIDQPCPGFANLVFGEENDIQTFVGRPFRAFVGEEKSICNEPVQALGEFFGRHLGLLLEPFLCGGVVSPSLRQ